MTKSSLLRRALAITVIAALVPSAGYADPIHDAAKKGDTAKVKELIDAGVDVNAQDDQKQAPLNYAAYNQKEVVKLLIANGADVNLKGQNSDTPLHKAADWGNVETGLLLIEAGADLEATNWCGRTPLHRTADMGKPEMVKLLLEKGAKVNARDNDQYTPLHLAAARGWVDVTKILLDNGAEINAVAEYKRTPLHQAADAFYTGAKYGDVIKLLIAKGADLKATNDKGETPLDATRRRKKPKLAAILENSEKQPAPKVEQPEKTNTQESVTRTWTSHTGSTIEAQLVNVKGDTVSLKTVAGKTLRVNRSALSKKDQQYIDDVSASFASPARGGQVKSSAENIVNSAPREEKWMDLTAFDPQFESASDTGMNDVTKLDDWARGLIRESGIVDKCSKWIYCHPNKGSDGVVVVKVPKPVRQFRSRIAIGRTQGRGDAVFVLLADGKEVFRSESMVGGQSPKEVNLTFAPCRELRLVSDRNGSWTHDLCIWLEPMVR